MKRQAESSSSDPAKKRVRIDQDANIEYSHHGGACLSDGDGDLDLLEMTTHKSKRKNFTDIDDDSESDSGNSGDEKEPEFVKPKAPEQEAEQLALSIPTHENTGDIPIIPYSMKADMEEGDIDEQGHYIKRTLRAEDADAHVVHDSWMTGISQVSA
jgi:hypothetical protein